MKGQVLYLGRIGGKSTGNGEATMKEDRQDRLQRVSIKKYCMAPLLCHVASSIAHIFNCFLTEPETCKRKVDSEEEEEDEEDEEDEEEVNKPERDEEAAKRIWPHKGKRPRGRPPKITSQQKKPRGRPPKITSHLNRRRDQGGVLPRSHLNRRRDQGGVLPRSHLNRRRDQGGILPRSHLNRRRDQGGVLPRSSPSNRRQAIDQRNIVATSQEGERTCLLQ